MHWLNICNFESSLSRCIAVGPGVIRPVDLETLDVGPSIFPIYEDVDKCEFSPMQDGEHDEQQTGVVVQGRLKQCQSFWRDTLGASAFVLGIISDGYVLPLLADPPPVCFRNHHSALLHGDFVQKEISNLLKGNCVVPCAECPQVCNPLLVVSNVSGKKRLVIDLRYVNQFLRLQKFKYEGLPLVPQLFNKGEFFVTFDLKSGYHHVDIHPTGWKYLGFSWGTGDQRQFYVFRVLPFGLASACYVFTKLLRPLVRRWRSLGIRCIVYIDDGIVGAESHQAAKLASDIVTSDLDLSGLVLNVIKSHLTPMQIGRWLGFIIDLCAGTYHVPEDRITKLKEALALVLGYSTVPVRLLASVVGQLIAMGLAIGPITRLRTRALYQAVNARHFWSDKLQLSDEVLEEVQFWQVAIDSLNGQPIWFSPSATRVAYSDASSSGYGGYVVEVANDVAQGHWSPEEAMHSSTWRELKALERVLLSFVPRLKGHTVKWFTDNQNVARIVQFGSRKQHLQDGVLSIFSICLKANIRLEMEWIPRSANERADYVSKIVDYDDWMLDPAIFQQLEACWGPHTIDRFATEHNSQINRFDSRFWCPFSEAMDTFTRDWCGENNWWVPPVYLVCRTIRHAQSCCSMGTLVCPRWESAPFWPLICPDGVHLADFVHDWCEIPFYSGLTIPGRSGGNIGSSLQLDSTWLALRIDFSVPRRQNKLLFCTTMQRSCSVCSCC